VTEIEASSGPHFDPREVLSSWANESDEWVRFLVGIVLSTGRPATKDDIDHAYGLFREEKALDGRSHPAVPPLAHGEREEDAEKTLVITSISDVRGVNALATGPTIDPHEGLTILFGENGTGKTGYSRIFKALADSRTADDILGDIAATTRVAQSATVAYTLGGSADVMIWSGERGVAPFTRMSVFDSPSVNFHVDDDLEYVYVPAALALFNHVIAGLRQVQDRIESRRKELTSTRLTLVSRFDKKSSVFPLLETLGASSDLNDLKAQADFEPDAKNRIDVLRRAVAALEGGSLDAELKLMRRSSRVLEQADACASMLVNLDRDAYNDALVERRSRIADRATLRSELFAAAALPAEPEATWETFVSAGDVYQGHLAEVGEHESEKCPYCRQTLGDDALALLSRYKEYLTDQIASEIATLTMTIEAVADSVANVEFGEAASLLVEYEARDDAPGWLSVLAAINDQRSVDHDATQAGHELMDSANAEDLREEISGNCRDVAAQLDSLESQAKNSAVALAEKQAELTELVASEELAQSWPTIQSHVDGAKEADRLGLLGGKIPNLSRTLTGLAKSASDKLINENFDLLFAEECEALRAPALKLEFVGRQGRAHRRKTLAGKHKPSKVLSEGEQKVLALADFLAEARLAGITAPVVFDDPVSSLDHRRIKEVSDRIAVLSENTQVVVFTHDIFFATNLLSRFEKSKRCTYFQITDEPENGFVTRASGPRWDTMSSIKANINSTIEAARAESGEARAALIRTGYDWIRSWCEVFTETELLRGATQRYQPNVRMTVLPSIRADLLPELIEVVTRIFEDACRFIDGHSQPLASLGVAPSLAGLEAHWDELKNCKKAHDTP